MIREAIEMLSSWGSLDTWIVIASAMTSMSCCVPGVFLLVRRQSMLGDTLSHTALPGITLGFLAALWLREQQWLSDEEFTDSRHAIVVAGAMVVGVLSAMLTELVQKLGRVDANAALGVVFTSVFALGLILLRKFADRVDLDPNCVLYGTIETTTTDLFGDTGIPRAVVVNGAMLAGNLFLTVLFFKELRITAFDPAFARTVGIHTAVVQYCLTAITAATLVAAFESVGSILVIAMLVGPAATARLLTDRIRTMIWLSLGTACLAALLGHVAAITVPAIVFSRLGFTTVIDASTAGTTAVACGTLFVLAALFGPRYGILSRWLRRWRMALTVASEDILGQLYRLEESSTAAKGSLSARTASTLQRIAWYRLRWNGEITWSGTAWQLTSSGYSHAEQLVRAHRLWESYMAKHFELPEDHLHDTAERVEHFIDRAMRGELASELAAPGLDPHGRAIPSESPPHAAPRADTSEVADHVAASSSRQSPPNG
jgi:manganese/zinc/iron transport system permease protein